MPRYSCVLTFCVITAAGLFPGTVTPKAYGLAESVGPDGSNAQAVHKLGYLGQDVNVGLISAKNTRTTHEAFKDTNGISHAFYYDFTVDNCIDCKLKLELETDMVVREAWNLKEGVL